jgi:TetR/AcrR family transcriptional regulator
VPRPGSKGAKTREAILRAAEQLFAEKGFAACRLEDIGASVGIRRASIVYHFRDKPTLYDAVLDGVFGSLLDRYRIVFSGPEPVADRLLGMIDAWVTYVGERPSLVRLFLRAVMEPNVHSAVSRHVLPIMDELVGFLRQGQEQGVFAPVDPEHFFNAIGGMTVFLVTARPILWPGRADETSKPDILEKHRKELLGITRRLLGLPMGAEASAPGEPRQTARVGGSA